MDHRHLTHTILGKDADDEKYVLAQKVNRDTPIKLNQPSLIIIVAILLCPGVTHPSAFVTFRDGDKVHDSHRSHFSKQGDHKSSPEDSSKMKSQPLKWMDVSGDFSSPVSVYLFDRLLIVYKHLYQFDCFKAGNMMEGTGLSIQYYHIASQITDLTLQIEYK